MWRRQIKNILLRFPPGVRRPFIRVAFRAWERYLVFRARGAGTESIGRDGLPIPPPELRVLVSGKPDVGWFLRGNQQQTNYLRGLLKEHGAPMERMDAILDFGCGCGRMLRCWGDLDASVFGCDYNPVLARWADANIPFATVVANGLLPPLPYADAQFDFVYALSIFTHFTRSTAEAWFAELVRVTKPGGHLWITVHGNSYQDRLSPHEQAHFRSGELIVHFPEVEGTNLCATYWPRSALEQLARRSGCALVDALEVSADPQAALENEIFQDAYLLRREAGLYAQIVDDVRSREMAPSRSTRSPQQTR